MIGVIFASAIAPLLASIRFASEEEEVMGAYFGSLLLFICAAVLFWGGVTFVRSAQLASSRILLGASCVIALLSVIGLITLSAAMP
ncbi:MAG: hypothetical protein JNJ53_09555 [Rhizobiales bacterium]|nr:hypothetical protein [Hyphomicrobiales bacterium]